MIAKNFKFLYKHFKDKQEVLAKMFNVPQSNISGYVNGTKPIPVDILQKIAITFWKITTRRKFSKKSVLPFFRICLQ